MRVVRAAAQGGLRDPAGAAGVRPAGARAGPGAHRGGGGGARRKRPRGVPAPRLCGIAPRPWEKGRWADVWERCEECGRWHAFEAGEETKSCPCGMPVRRWSTGAAGEGGSERTNWVQCDICFKWRAVEGDVLAALEAKGDDAKWHCGERYDGATCDTPDDWQLEIKRERTMDRKRAEAEERALHEDIEAAVAESRRQQRSWRTAQRASGVAVALREEQEPLVDFRAALEAGGPAATRRSFACDRMHTRRILSESMRSEGGDARPGAWANLPAADVWEQCSECCRWVNLGTAGEDTECECGHVVTHSRARGARGYRHWAQCSECGKWRAVSAHMLRQIESLGEHVVWTCRQLKEGATCRTRVGDWGSEVRKEAQTSKAAALGALEPGCPPERPEAVSLKVCLTRKVQPSQEAQAATVFAKAIPLKQSARFVEYVPGRDTLHAAGALAAGLHLFDATSAEHVLSTGALPDEAFFALVPFVERALELYQRRSLPVNQDGRSSCGPVDLAAFMALPSVQAQVHDALRRRRERILGLVGVLEKASEAELLPRFPRELLSHVVHVSPNQRTVFVGDECDTTSNGKPLMDFNKSWKSLPIPSWSGGKKMADMMGRNGAQLVDNALSRLLGGEESFLAEAAESAWGVFASQAETRLAARRMIEHCEQDPVKNESRIGRSGWNAYNLNINYRTGAHIDGKNVPGSYSCVLVMELGETPYHGGFYMLPQYHQALDIRQGTMVFHRSGDKDVGMHGNSEIWCPDGESVRISVVLYLTEIKQEQDLAPQAEALPVGGAGIVPGQGAPGSAVAGGEAPEEGLLLPAAKRRG